MWCWGSVGPPGCPVPTLALGPVLTRAQFPHLRAGGSRFPGRGGTQGTAALPSAWSWGWGQGGGKAADLSPLLTGSAPSSSSSSPPYTSGSRCAQQVREEPEVRMFTRPACALRWAEPCPHLGGIWPLVLVPETFRQSQKGRGLRGRACSRPFLHLSSNIYCLCSERWR